MPNYGAEKAVAQAERGGLGDAKLLGALLEGQAFYQALAYLEEALFVPEPGQGRVGSCIEGLPAGKAAVSLQAPAVPVFDRVLGFAVRAALAHSTGFQGAHSKAVAATFLGRRQQQLNLLFAHMPKAAEQSLELVIPHAILL